MKHIHTFESFLNEDAYNANRMDFKQANQITLNMADIKRRLESAYQSVKDLCTLELEFDRTKVVGAEEYITKRFAFLVRSAVAKNPVEGKKALAAAEKAMKDAGFNVVAEEMELWGKGRRLAAVTIPDVDFVKNYGKGPLAKEVVTKFG